jgi:hypothetical protein
MALTFKWFRCLDCGYSGEITTEEIAAHRSKCARGTTEPIAEQPRAAEQDEREQEQLLKERDEMEERLTILAEAVGHYFDVPVGEWSNCNSPDQVALAILNGEYKTKFSKQPTQPPAGDVDPNAEVVTRMMNANFAASGTPYSYPPKMCKGMAAALAVAREGYVSLDDVEKAIREVWHPYLQESTALDGFVHHVRARLAKPAERVTVSDIGGHPFAVKLDGKHVKGFGIRLDAERYAAGLREELKAGKA